MTRRLRPARALRAAPSASRLLPCVLRRSLGALAAILAAAAVVVFALAALATRAHATGATDTATVTTLSPTADARVVESRPTTNYGTSNYLRVDGGTGTQVQSYLRFSVAGVSGLVTSATLRVYAKTPTLDGASVYATGDNWSEDGITWSNRPAIDGDALDSVGAIAAGEWADFDVTAAVVGNGTYDFVLATTSTDGATFASREAAAATPELVVTVAPTPPPPPCTKYAEPSANVQEFVDSLVPGDTGCLHGGTYPGNVRFSHSGVTLTSAPDERATIAGYVRIPDDADGVTVSNLNIDGSSATPITLHVYGDDAHVSGNDITNDGLSQSCLILGSLTYGIARDAVVDHNRIHDCGDAQLDHGIYAADVTGATQIRDNVVYDVAYGFGIKLSPNAQGALVEGNVVDGSGRDGVIFGQNTGLEVYASSNNDVRQNVITSNAGYGVTSFFPTVIGTGNTVEFNCLFDNRLGAFGNYGEGYVEHDNVFADPIYADRAAKDFRPRADGPCGAFGPH